MNFNDTINQLLERWQHLLASFEVTPDIAQVTFTQIVTAYSSPKRYYHTLEHIEYILNIIESLQDKTQNLEVVQLAAWFHDLVYDTQAHDNEERSAKYASHLLASLRLSSRIIATVSRLILSTKFHQAAPNDIDCQVLLDADLAILGSPPVEYGNYAVAIRQEYAWVPQAEYLAGRKQVLQQFLQRDRIYYTPFMFQAFELSARSNILQEIQQINNTVLEKSYDK
ncbi:HD domain-containing protein [Scytonema sp. UIC 10036]|uniref:HD domain-containing protein n=1 Tax=Scytonema sp. UIC 10036 TaxID=2304196 RepID=UPI0012DA30E3|nr:HD domain-containing protein [Scytonema sp. UIC 10036]MUG95747.1 HD domain-containing protein [Scytonema sp. UIC 10036]